MVQINGKRTLFSQNWSDINNAKKYRLQDFYYTCTFDLHDCVRDMMTKTGTADFMKCASKIYFRTIHHADKYWIMPER